MRLNNGFDSHLKKGNPWQENKFPALKALGVKKAT
jgi:hypothetical protein